MAYLDDLRTRRTAVAAQIAALGTTAQGAKPNASGEGLNVDHTGYKKSLYQELKDVNELIAAAELDGEGGTPAGITISEEYC